MSAQLGLRRRAVLGGLAAGFGVPIFPSSAKTAQGFIGELEFRAVEKPDATVLFELLKDFGYIDSTGARWQAKTGALTDGASIPRVLWPITGHPYQGPYLKAAVIHDYYCDRENRYRKWENVHRVFYDGMSFNGVSAIKAALMYFAVWRFGPRWDVAELKPCTPGPNQFCASAQVTGYRVFSADVKSFDIAEEEAQLREFESSASRKLPPLEDIPAYEASLPKVERAQSMLDVDAKSDKGWLFRNPYRMPIIAPR